MEVLRSSLEKTGNLLQDFIQQYRCELSGISVAALILYLILAPKAPRELRFCISHPLLKFLLIFVVVHLLGYDPLTTLLLTLIILVIIQMLSNQSENMDDIQKIPIETQEELSLEKSIENAPGSPLLSVEENNIIGNDLNDIQLQSIEEKQIEQVDVENTNLISCAGRKYNSDEIIGHSNDLLFAEVEK